MWLHLVGATTATSRKAWAMANKTTKKKGTTVGGYVLVNSCKCHLTSHTTVNTSMIVQLAYHRLYNRPASPLSCLCSSSCSSPLLNKKKKKIWRCWFTSKWDMNSINTGFVVITRPRQTWAASLRGWTDSFLIQTLVKRSWPGCGLGALLQTYPSLPFPSPSPKL